MALALSATAVDAQPEGSRRSAWGDSSAIALARRAIARRMGELADTTLHDWRATARGHLAFLGQIGDGWIETPKLVQTEELALDLAWRRPNQSVQRLVGRRDSLLLPGNVGYYRSRYAVVLNDLPDLIRLGDGRDVRDVPHPLAPEGLSLYEVALGDTLRIRLPGGAIDVQELLVRPRDPRAPRVVGTVYVDASNAAVVRLSFTFTRAALLDPRIETLAVTLENGLVSGRYWLPRRQEVEVARRDKWLDIPARGVVRGRWDISGYSVNDSVPVAQLLSRYPPWSSAPADSLRAYAFGGSVLDRLPADIAMTTDEEVREVRVKAEAAVREALLVRRSGTALSGRGVSDALRINRVEGVAVGFGLSRTFGSVLRPSARMRYGFSDRELKGRVAIGRVTSPGSPSVGVELWAERDYRDVLGGERSGAANSLASLFGSDATLPVDVRGVGLTLVRPLRPGRTARIELGVERQAPLRVRFDAPIGTFEPSTVARPIEAARLRIDVGSSMAGSGDGWRRSWRVGGGLVVHGDWESWRDPDARPSSNPMFEDIVLSGGQALARLDGQATLDRSWRGGARGARVQLSAQMQRATTDVAPQLALFAGGPASGPGYPVGVLEGAALGSVRGELRYAVPFLPIPLRQFGTAPKRMVLVPFVHAVAVGGPPRQFRFDYRTSGVYPSVGLGGLFVFDLIRVDVARGLRNGQWMLNIDVDRAFWGIL
jgi:hypothetical protein